MKFELRAANPSIDDGLVFARYLDQAAEGFFRLMLGRRVEHIIAAAFVQPDHDLSYQSVTFVECDNSIVGMVSGFTGAQHRRSSLQPLKQAAGKHRFRMMIVLTMFAPIMRVIDSVSDDAFYLQAIAVDKKFRGKGVGANLMDSIEKKARACGSIRLSLDVAAKNEEARRFYERRGMSVEIQRRMLYRMTKRI